MGIHLVLRYEKNSQRVLAIIIYLYIIIIIFVIFTTGFLPPQLNTLPNNNTPLNNMNSQRQYNRTGGGLVPINPNNNNNNNNNNNDNNNNNRFNRKKNKPHVDPNSTTLSIADIPAQLNTITSLSGYFSKFGNNKNNNNNKKGK